MKKALHIDLGGISYHPDEKLTGIPRVTLTLAKEMSRMGTYRDLNLNVMSLLHENQSVPDEIVERFDLTKREQDLATSEGVIFLLDVYYFKYNFLNKLPSEIRNRYTIVDYVHDILPVTRDGLFDVSPFRFKHLLYQTFQFSDAVMTPSRQTADDIVEYILANENLPIGESLKIGYSYHGADFADDFDADTLLNSERPVKQPYFLMVGTLEVRKNHLHVINVFEKLWAEGIDVTLCIAGRIGWKVEILVQEKLQGHPELNKRLFFFNGPSDEELAQLYIHSYCLIFASMDEGFGLPVVEAAHYKVPLLLSEIPIFHEIAGENARYFSLDDEKHLVQAIKEFIRDDKAGSRKEDSGKIEMITWSESAANILDSIIDDHWYCQIDQDRNVHYSENRSLPK